MGQYYFGFTESKDGKRIAWDNPSGLKLMEHSYFGNEMVMQMLKAIYKNPCRVGWVGDYADDFYRWMKEDRPNFNNLDKIMDVFNFVYPKSGDAKRTSGDFLEGNDFYLINHSKKEYYDLRKYLEGLEEEYENEWDLYIHPLPMLTCIGNDCGGGDYHESVGINYEMVGYWFYDVITLEDKDYKIPADYTNVTNAADYYFVEMQNR